MTAETKQIGIHIGAMCEPIHKQLQAQGVKVTKENVTHFQRAHDGFVQLRVLGCMGDKEADRIGQRLVNAITKFIKRNPQLVEGNSSKM